METYEYNFCLCAINIGILLHIKLFKGIRITKHIMLVQGSPFIKLCLGSIELDCVISEPRYKGILFIKTL